MQKIDFVLTWVDDSDPAWIAEKNKYDVKQTLPSVRVRDSDFLIYWFRSVEKYAPWVNKIHLVTWGHVPTFLNINHDKVNIVNHSEIFDEQYLPIFSTTALELSLHKIPGSQKISCILMMICLSIRMLRLKIFLWMVSRKILDL
ncbi:Stealth CR1 domain-containing protein [Weissella cibaria]|uniref:Stealth CR1 domain-containing protein n=1 Tax=Weissella cibaria TaxID=137591 RepID=UPI0036DCD8F5